MNAFSFTHKANNSSFFTYHTGQILRTDCADDLGVMLATILYFHQRVNCKIQHLLDRIRFISK
jgi:hypothetical protein